MKFLENPAYDAVKTILLMIVAALISFQETFHKVMLDPWGLKHGTGFKYKTTDKYLNEIQGCVTSVVDLDGQGTFNY